MDELVELISNIAINGFDTGSEHWVDITHINNPHSFFIRPTAYRKYLDTLEAPGGNIDSTEIYIGITVVYKSRILMRYIRGEIVFIENDENGITCDIFAPDIGLFEKSISGKRIRKQLNEVKVPQLIQHCQLADCKPIGEHFSEQIVETMKLYVDGERAKMIVRGKARDKLIVELINSCPDDIATMLAYAGETTLGYDTNVVNRFEAPKSEVPNYTFKQLNIGDVLHVRVQSGNSLNNFYVAVVKDHKDCINRRPDFTYDCKRQKPISPEELQENVPVGALKIQYNYYERGLTKQITVPGSKAMVQLVDSGIITEYDISKLKPMARSSFYYPVVAINCSAKESQTWNNGLPKFLYPGFEFLIIVKVVGNKFQTPNIVDIKPLK